MTTTVQRAATQGVACALTGGQARALAFAAPQLVVYARFMYDVSRQPHGKAAATGNASSHLAALETAQLLTTFANDDVIAALDGELAPPTGRGRPPRYCCITWAGLLVHTAARRAWASVSTAPPEWTDLANQLTFMHGQGQALAMIIGRDDTTRDTLVAHGILLERSATRQLDSLQQRGWIRLDDADAGVFRATTAAHLLTLGLAWAQPDAAETWPHGTAAVLSPTPPPGWR